MWESHGVGCLVVSLGTRPLKNWIRRVWHIGWYGREHCTWYVGALRIGFWLAFWGALIGNANRTRTVFTFCFILESCKHQVGKIECLYDVCLVQQKTLQALQGSAINKIPNIPQCTLPPWPVYQTFLSDFLRVRLRDYPVVSSNTILSGIRGVQMKVFTADDF